MSLEFAYDLEIVFTTLYKDGPIISKTSVHGSQNPSMSVDLLRQKVRVSGLFLASSYCGSYLSHRAGCMSTNGEVSRKPSLPSLYSMLSPQTLGRFSICGLQ